MSKKIEDQLKALMISRCGNMKNFSEKYDIPYSTIQTLLKRGIQSGGIGTLKKICQALDITLDGLAYGEIRLVEEPEYTDSSKDYLLLHKYHELDQHGKEVVDYILNCEYKRVQDKNDDNVIIYPMYDANLYQEPIGMTELDYYPMAAGMGRGRSVESAVPEKIEYPSSLIPPETDYVIRVSGNSMEPTFSSGDRLFIKSTDHLKQGEIGVFSYMGEQLVKECGDGQLISHNPNYPPIQIVGDCYIQGKVLGKLNM